MTEGKIFGKMISFIIPLMLTNLLQTFYNAADMMIVGLSPEENAVGAIGVAGPVLTLFINMFIGFSTGTGVLVARHLGARNHNGVSKTVHTSMAVSVILGTVGGALGAILSRYLLILMGADANLLDLATTYTFVYFCGFPFVAITNYAVQIIRAKGDTRTPLIVLGISGLANVVMNIFFVLVCKMDVDGVALATALSNVISAVILVIVLMREDGPCRFEFKKLSIDGDSLKGVIAIGLPAGIQGALFSVSNLIIQSSLITVDNLLKPAGTEYAPVISANAAVSNLNSFIYTATTSVYLASTTFTSQNVGAKKYDRLPRVMACAYAITISVGIIASTLIFIFHKPLIALYGVHDGAEGTLQHIAYQTAYTKILVETMTYFLLAFMEVGSGIMRGLGKSLTSTVITLIGTCALRIVWIYTAFAAYQNVATIYMSYPISWSVTGIVQLAFGVILIRRLIRKQRQSDEFETLTTA